MSGAVVQRWPWPLPALVAWAAAWGSFYAARGVGLPPTATLLLATTTGVVFSLLGSSLPRKLIMALGFPLSWGLLIGAAAGAALAAAIRGQHGIGEGFAPREATRLGLHVGHRLGLPRVPVLRAHRPVDAGEEDHRPGAAESGRFGIQNNLTHAWSLIGEQKPGPGSAPRHRVVPLPAQILCRSSHGRAHWRGAPETLS